MNNETTMTSFTSPRTGLTYEVVAKTDRRVVGFENGAAVWQDQPKFDILLGGKWVQFALSEAGIPDAVAHAEGVSDGWTSSPRD